LHIGEPNYLLKYIEQNGIDNLPHNLNELPEEKYNTHTITVEDKAYIQLPSPNSEYVIIFYPRNGSTQYDYEMTGITYDTEHLNATSQEVRDKLNAL